MSDQQESHYNDSRTDAWATVAVVTIISAAYHIVVSDYYLTAWYQAMLFVLVTLAAAFGRAYWIKLGQLPVATNVSYFVVSVVFGALFVAVRNLPL